MEPMKPVVNHDFSVNHEATFKKADGTTASAKDFICAELPIICDGLDAAAALSKNFIVKMCIGIVKSAIEALGLAFCGQE
jgi:hypothetical protein